MPRPNSPACQCSIGIIVAVDLVAARRAASRDVQPLAVVVLRQRDQRLEAFEVKVRRIVRTQPRGQVVDDHRLVGVDDLAEQPAGQLGQAVALRPRVDVR